MHDCPKAFDERMLWGGVMIMRAAQPTTAGICRSSGYAIVTKRGKNSPDSTGSSIISMHNEQTW